MAVEERALEGGREGGGKGREREGRGRRGGEERRVMGDVATKRGVVASIGRKEGREVRR